MGNTKKIPALRFIGFEGEWEEMKLGGLGKFKNGMNFGKDAMGLGYPFVNLENVFGKNVVEVSNLGLAESTENQRKEYNLLKGDILFIRSSVKPEGVGEAAVILKDIPNTTYSGFIIRFRPEVDLFIEYSRFLFTTNVFRKQVLSNATSSANTNINQSSLQKLEVSIPHLSEQTQIGNYFKDLDELIRLQEQKLQQQSQLKKAMLQKMFPQDGADTPQIRFKGFNDAWEKKTLGEVAEKFYGGGTPSTSNLNYWNGDIPWIQSSDLEEGNLLKISIRKRITSLGLKNSATKLIPANSITIVTRVGFGKLCIIPFSFSTSQDFLSMSNLNIDIYFGVFAINNTIQKELNFVQGTSIKGITKDELLKKEIKVPTIKEQQKIGAYFQNLDQLISQSQQGIRQLKNLKQALLQKMFI